MTTTYQYRGYTLMIYPDRVDIYYGSDLVDNTALDASGAEVIIDDWHNAR